MVQLTDPPSVNDGTLNKMKSEKELDFFSEIISEPKSRFFFPKKNEAEPRCYCRMGQLTRLSTSRTAVSHRRLWCAEAGVRTDLHVPFSRCTCIDDRYVSGVFRAG